MKKLLLLVMLLGISLVQAKEQRVEINNTSKEVRVVEQEIDEWQALTPVELLAYNNPGIEQPVLYLKKIQRVDFFHYIEIKEYDEVVIYESGHIQYLAKTGVEKSETKLAWVVIFLLIAILPMVISNICKKKGYTGLAAAFALFAAFFTFVALFAALDVFALFIFAALVAFAIFAALVAFAAAVDNNSNGYKVFSIMFYICAIILILLF